MGPQRCLELLRVRTVHAERLLRPDGFGHTVRLDRTIVAAEGEVVEGLAVSAESSGQDGARRALELADPGEAEVAESLRHDPADAVKPVSARIRALIRRTAASGLPKGDSVPLRSTNASSTDTGSTSGEKS